MTERPVETIELMLSICEPALVVFGHGFKSDRIPDEMYGEVQQMVNKHYLKMPVTYTLGNAPCGNQVIRVHWAAQQYDEPKAMQLWDRMVKAVGC